MDENSPGLIPSDHPKLIYELVTAGFGTALMGIFGILMMMPVEVMILASEETNFYAYILIAFTVLFAFWYLTVYAENARWILRFTDIIAVIIAGFVLWNYMAFTSDYSGPWMVEGVWFLRENGILVGIYLALTVFKASAALTVVTSLTQERSSQNSRLPYSMGAAISILIFSFLISGLLIYRYLNPFWFYSFILGIQLVLGILSLVSLYKNRIPVAFEFNPNVYSEFPPYTGHRKERSGNLRVKAWLEEKLKPHGLIVDFRLWKLFKRTRVIAIFLIIAFILHALKLSFKAFHPIEYAAVVFFITFIGLFVFMTSMSYADKENTQSGYLFSKRISPVWIRLCGILELFGLIIVFSFVLYYYTNPMYIPQVLAEKFAFGIAGAIGYYIIVGLISNRISPKTSRMIAIILYITALTFLILNIQWIVADGLTYGSAYGGESTENVFVFAYLHSVENNALVGIALGIIFSDFLYRFALKGDKGHRTQARGILIVLVPFILGLMMTIFNYILVATPGGLYPYESPTVFQNLGQFLQWVCGLILFLYLVPYVLFPLGRRLFINTSKNFSPLAVKRKDSPSLMQNPNYPKVLKATGLIALVGFSLVVGVALPVAYSQYYQKPIVIHSPGQYFVWVEQSSALVVSDTRVAVTTSPEIDYAELNLAKNEYGALQLVWHPDRTDLTNCTYEISNFTHISLSDTTIPSTACSLRYVRQLIDNEYPDLLMPFTQLQVNRSQNTALWFSIRTPYECEAGSYRGSVTFHFNLDGQAKTESVPIQINVWNFTIPLTHHLRTRYGCGDWNNAAERDSYFSHRANSDGPSMVTTTDWNTFTTGVNITAFMNATTREWIFNWTAYDYQIEYLLSRHGNLFSVGFGAGFGRDPDLSDPLLKDQIQNFLRGLQAHLDAKNWSQYAYMYFIDEFEMFIPAGMTRAEYFAKLAIVMNWINEVTPRIKLTAVSPPEEDLVYYLNDYIDIYCPTTYDRDKPMWDARIAEGKEMWYYVCVGPILPYPNNHLYNRLYEGRLLDWQMWLYGLRGTLGWAVHYNRHGAYSVGYNGYSDGVFIYYEKGQLLESIRWEMVLEGIEDYEYFWIFNQTLYQLERIGALSPDQIAHYRQGLHDQIDRVVGEKWYYTDHVADIYEGRKWVGDQLQSLSSLTNLTTIAELRINWLDFSLY